MADAGRVGVIVQARMRSRRLPGKVLRLLNGKPLLQYVLERVSCCPRVDSIVVCTSTEADDDPIEAFCLAEAFPCFRGEHENVAKRYLGALDRFGFDAFVRVCGDSPLIDQGLIDKGLEIYATGRETGSTIGWKTGSARRYEIVTNRLQRVGGAPRGAAATQAFPAGQAVEVLNAEAYRRGYVRMVTPEHFEHVTRFFYEHPADFRIFSLTSDYGVEPVREGILAPAEGPTFQSEQRLAGKPVLHPKLSVDTQGDFDRIAEVIGRMDRPHWEYNWREIVDDLCAVSA